MGPRVRDACQLRAASEGIIGGCYGGAVHAHILGKLVVLEVFDSCGGGGGRDGCCPLRERGCLARRRGPWRPNPLSGAFRGINFCRWNEACDRQVRLWRLAQ